MLSNTLCAFPEEVDTQHLGASRPLRPIEGRPEQPEEVGVGANQPRQQALVPRGRLIARHGLQCPPSPGVGLPGARFLRVSAALSCLPRLRLRGFLLAAEADPQDTQSLQPKACSLPRNPSATPASTL